MPPVSARTAEGLIAPSDAPALPRLLIGATSTAWLAAVFVAAAAAAALVLLAPGRVFSREMTWDLLFNLEGAWQIAHGQRPYVDFHDPLGVLGFQLTRLGFLVVGIRPLAFLVGECLAAAALGVAAVHASARRLPPLPAALFVAYVAALVLLPTNIGDPPHAYSFAMSYNRLGWAALATLCLVLCVPPATPSRRPAGDLAVAAALCVALFYVKVTYAAAALGALGAATLLAPHLQPARRWWVALGAALVLFAALPMHHAYIRDAWIIGSARARTDLYYLVNTVVANRAEYTLHGLAVGLLAWLWQSGRTNAAPMVAAGSLTMLGAAVLTQNAQDADIPLGVVVWLIVYSTVATATRAAAPRERAMLLMLVLLWPVVSLAGAAKVYAGYFRAATADDLLVASAGTNLRGLAVSRRQGEGPSSAPVGAASQADYVASLLAAADTLRGAPVRVLVLDQVNPLPFVLGYPPPRGGVLWLGPAAPDRPADELFGDVDVVLVPTHSSNPAVTGLALDVYGPYLAQAFPARTTTADWTYLRRAPATTPRPR